MVFLNSALLMIALNMLFQNNTGTIAGAGLFSFLNIKERYIMIARLVVPLLQKMFKNKYGAFIYQVCQASGVLMFVIGSTAFLGHLAREESVYHYNWFGEDIGIALGTSIGFMVGGLALFFMVLLIDDKLNKLDKKYEEKFKKLNEK